MIMRFFMRRGDAAEWTSVNPVLGPAECGYEEDTGFLKIGDGVTAWNSLAYFAGTAGSGVPDGGLTGEVLTKLSNADGDADWVAPSGSVTPEAIRDAGYWTPLTTGEPFPDFIFADDGSCIMVWVPTP